MSIPAIGPEHWTMTVAVASMTVPDDVDTEQLGRDLVDAVAAASDVADERGPAWVIRADLYQQEILPEEEAAGIALAERQGLGDEVAGHQMIVYGFALYLLNGDGRPAWEDLLTRARDAMDAVVKATGSCGGVAVLPVPLEALTKMVAAAVARFQAR
ncbi:hypothetical protein [Actinocorallia aurea]